MSAGSISLKRFNSKSSYADVRMDDGFPKELDKEVIHGFGNAIVPQIACEIFKAIGILYLEREGKKNY